jgi:broad specificity phosphatase PhoE
LEGKRIDRVFSSDTVRARETAALALPDRTPELSPLLREIGVGDLAGKSVEQCAEEFGERYLLAREKRDFREFGGESSEEHWDRAVKFMKSMEREEEETVAVFSHEGTLRKLYYYAMNLPFDPKGMPCKNGGVCVFRYEKGIWHVDGWDLPEEN